MGTENNVITFEQLGERFTSLFQRRAFRLETLDYYDAPNEREPYARFRAGEPADPAWREPWKKLVREVLASGRIIQRVKVVNEPVSDYIRFSLLHASPASVQAGEDVRVLGRRRAITAGLAIGGDYWLFDDNLAVFIDYDSSGQIECVDAVDTPLVLTQFRSKRDETLDLALPLAEYVTLHNITEGRTQAA